MEKDSKIQKLMKDNNNQNIKLREVQEKLKKITENYKGQLNISAQFKEKIDTLEQFKIISAQKITNLEKLIFSSNLNINFIGNRDFYKTTLAIILYNEKLNIYNNKKKVKSAYEIDKELTKFYEEKMNKQNEYEIKEKMQVSEFCFFL